MVKMDRFDFKQGQKIILVLINQEVITGDFVAATKNYIDLTNVTEYPSTNKLNGVFTYYRSEINDVRLAEESPPEKRETDTEEEPQFQLQKEELNRLTKVVDNYVYIKDKDEAYIEAVNYLSNCENIGIFGIRNDDNTCLSLLILSSWDQVYIFDIISLQDVPSKLKSILTSNRIKKVSHDFRELVACLHIHYKICLKNIFDTSVADLFIRKKLNGDAPDKIQKYSNCLKHYLGIPLYILLKIKDESHDIWSKRPVSAVNNLNLSIRVAFLITLKNRLEFIMLENYYHAVDIYSVSLQTTSVKEKIKLRSSDECRFNFKKVLKQL